MAPLHVLAFMQMSHVHVHVERGLQPQRQLRGVFFGLLLDNAVHGTDLAWSCSPDKLVHAAKFLSASCRLCSPIPSLPHTARLCKSHADPTALVQSALKDLENTMKVARSKEAASLPKPSSQAAQRPPADPLDLIEAGSNRDPLESDALLQVSPAIALAKAC